MKKNFKLPEEFANKWLFALRNGEYIQGEGHLIQLEGHNYCYCCLGVATQICNVPRPLTFNQEWIPSDLEYKIPEEIKGSLNDLPSVLSMLNDGVKAIVLDEYRQEHDLLPFTFRNISSETTNINTLYLKLTFDQIADFIEDNTEFYKKEE